MKNNKSLFGLGLAALVLLPGCYKVPTYRSKPLKSVSADFAYRGVQENVIVQAKRLTDEDFHYLLGQRADQINGSLEAIYLSVHNLGRTAYQLSSADINLAQVSYQDVVQWMKTSSVGALGRVAAGAGSGVASYYLTVISILCAKGYPGAIIGIPLIGFPLLGVISAGVALVYSGKFIKSLVMNGRIKRDLQEKMFQRSVTIPSGGQYDGLIFVKSSDYSPTFTVTMHEKDNVDTIITFDVDVRQNKQ